MERVCGGGHYFEPSSRLCDITRIEEPQDLVDGGSRRNQSVMPVEGAMKEKKQIDRAKMGLQWRGQRNQILCSSSSSFSCLDGSPSEKGRGGLMGEVGCGPGRLGIEERYHLWRCRTSPRTAPHEKQGSEENQIEIFGNPDQLRWIPR